MVHSQVDVPDSLMYANSSLEALESLLSLPVQVSSLRSMQALSHIAVGQGSSNLLLGFYNEVAW